MKEINNVETYNSNLFNFKVEIPELKEFKIRNKEYIGYGKDNKYPEMLLGYYNDCAYHQSIIDGLVIYTIGSGVSSTNARLQQFFESVNEDGDKIDDIVKKLLLDYFIFGGFTAKLTPNKGGELVDLSWIDFSNCRVNEDENTVYYARQFKGNTDPESFKYFNKKNTKTAQIFYCKGNKTRGVYPLPLYNGAVTSIATMIEISKFHLNNVANGFAVSTLFKFNNGIPTEDVKKENDKNLQKLFMGTEGKKFMTTYAPSKDKQVEIDKLDADNFGEQYDKLFDNCENVIFTAHKVTSPALFGIKPENNGFSKEEYVEAFELFSATVIKHYQEYIVQELNKMFSPYYSEPNVSILPYKLI